MAKEKGKTKTGTSGDQLALIDVDPENMKSIIPIARRYKKVQAARLAALNEEVELKQKILKLAREAKLQRLDDGKIKFKCKGVVITITPQDDKVSVKEDSTE